MEEVIDMLVEEKMSHKKYEELAENEEHEEYKEMFEKIAEDKHNHYKMLKEYLKQKMGM